jgi:hypothetical protein
MLGVGRGADLIFYGFIVVALMFFLVLYARIKNQQEELTKLARQIAIDQSSRYPQQDDH